MGLLTNPKTREKISNIISRYHNLLCVLCYIGGVGWFLALAYTPLNAGTYFSENALLPGLVEPNFHHDHGAPGYMDSLREEVKTIKEKSKREEENYKTPSRWFEEKFRELGLDTFIQNYTFQYPLGFLKGQKFQGQNVYGILRAPKAASTEAIVLSAPYRPPGSSQDRSAAGIALMYAVAKAFRRQTYWAKDVIFLVNEHEQIGMQAWLSAYHYDSGNEYIQPGELLGRSGSIQAAINLEIGMDTISKINIKLEGLNGQLPNLDLINTIVRLCKREGITPNLQKRTDPFNEVSFEGFQHSLKTMLMMMWNQAPGVPTGTHGLFHRYHIEAVTIQGVKMKNARKTFGYKEMGRVVEGVFRSLNNLLERFHQSFFFYLLPTTSRYVSIGLYMPPFGLIAAPILIKALALWIKLGIQAAERENKRESKEDNAEKTKKPSDTQSLDRSGTEDTSDVKEESLIKDPKNVEDSDEDASETKEDSDVDETSETKDIYENNESIEARDNVNDPENLPEENDATEEIEDGECWEDYEEEDEERSFSILSMLPVLITSVFFGLGSYVAPGYFLNSSTSLSARPQEALVFGLLAVQAAALAFPRLLTKKTNETGEIPTANWQLQKCVALLMLGVVLAATSVMNISLAFFIAVSWTPVVIIIRPTTNRLGNWIQYLLLLVISPMFMVFLAGLVHHVFVEKVSLAALPIHAWETALNGLLGSVLDSYMYGNWTYSLFTLTLVPNWLLFWSTLWLEPN